MQETIQKIIMSKPDASVLEESKLLAEFLRRQDAATRSAARGELKRAIVTKYCIYELAQDAKGIPVEEYFPGAKLPEALRGSKVYQTADGPVIAAPSRRRPGAGPAP